MKMNYFILHANCIPVKGASRSIICDLQMGKYHPIPNLLFDILSISREKTIDELKGLYKDNGAGIDKYFSYLSENGWGMFTNTPHYFPPMEMGWDNPKTINNAILDYNENSTYSIHSVVQKLNRIGCDAVQIRMFRKMSHQDIAGISTFFEGTRIRFVEIIVQFKKSYSVPKLKTILKQNKRIRQLTFYGAPFNKRYETNPTSSLGEIFFTTETIDSCASCGVVDKSYFVSNLSMFSESKSFNNCLNRKISVDVDGNIKNCPSLKKIYGNASDDFAEIFNRPEFQKIWNITKDQVLICRDCEYRYVCTDCRAYVKEDGDPYSKPLKCQYDPYQGKWKK